MFKVSSNKQYLIDFKKDIETPISSGAIRKIMKKWNKASIIEDQIRGRSGRAKDALMSENIALVGKHSILGGV